MKTHPSLANITKVYTTPDASQWMNTAMVRHEGTVIAFAQTSGGHFYYSVLNMSNPEKAGRFKHVDFWDDQPQQLDFPTEIVMAGMEAASLDELPVYRKNGGAPDPTEFVRIEERDPYQSTTACLSEIGAPFKVLSDGRYVHLFRQSIETSGTGHQVGPAILMDRFVFDGSRLKRKLEQRYQRSRSKSIPLCRKDTLGYQDLNKTPFYEPKHNLQSMLGTVKGGAFAVTLVPSMSPDDQNSQFFRVDEPAAMIRGIHLTRAPHGLFDERGPVFNVSSDRD
jgi:hypothetical protein